MGGLVGRRLEESGADVVRAHRGSGVDAVTGVGLADAIVGADVVVDCLNVTTSSGRKAIGFFAAAAGNVSRAVDAAGARLVCLSICNTADPAVNKRMGYYRGKAAQERVYRENLGDRATVVATTQWFELAATMLDRLSAGPIAMVPHMLTAPLAAVDGAAVIADTALGEAHQGKTLVTVRGPQRLDLADVGRVLRPQQGKRAPVAINFGGPALRDGRLIPDPADVVTETTLEQWLAF